MKKILSIAAAALIIFSGCNGDKLKQAEEQNGELNDSLHVALANQDSLLVLLNDITDGMNQIKDMEKILSNTSDLNAESASRKEQLRNDMAAIQQALQERRERLAQLESRLKKSQSYNGTLQRTIENLKAEIANQEATISTLRNDLAAAKIMVADLTTRVDSLNTTVANVTEERTRAEEHATAAENELNTCYYAIGTKKELKEAKIVETGFLRKTKLMSADFQQSYFTTADKRTLTTINTHAKKAKVLTNMPESSYTIEEVNGNQVVRITASKEFWSRSNYLVIQVD
jgi:chromosome segregation ATPase